MRASKLQLHVERDLKSGRKLEKVLWPDTVMILLNNNVKQFF